MQPEPISPGEPPTPPKARKTRLLLLGGITLLVLIIVSSLLAVALLPKKAATSGPSTPTIPAGFQPFSTPYFSIIYPQGWSINPGTSPISYEFYGGSAQTLYVYVDPTGGVPFIETGIDCSFLPYVTISGPSDVTFAGEAWSRRTCDTNFDRTVVEAVNHNGTLFTIMYSSLLENFDLDVAQYYQPMERSFKFLS
jgi:hypothetical protein